MVCNLNWYLLILQYTGVKGRLKPSWLIDSIMFAMIGTYSVVITLKASINLYGSCHLKSAGLYQ